MGGVLSMDLAMKAKTLHDHIFTVQEHDECVKKTRVGRGMWETSVILRFCTWVLAESSHGSVGYVVGRHLGVATTTQRNSRAKT